MAPGLKVSMIVACLALGAAGCAQRESGMAPMAAQPATSSNADGVVQGGPNGGMGGTMMQQCNTIKQRIASGTGLTGQMQAMIPQCERLLGANLTVPNAAPTPAQKSY